MCNKIKWRYMKYFECNEVEYEVVLILNIKVDKIN